MIGHSLRKKVTLDSDVQLERNTPLVDAQTETGDVYTFIETDGTGSLEDSVSPIQPTIRAKPKPKPKPKQPTTSIPVDGLPPTVRVIKENYQPGSLTQLDHQRATEFVDVKKTSDTRKRKRVATEPTRKSNRLRKEVV